MVLLRSHECAVLGAAILRAVGSEHFAIVPEAVGAMVDGSCPMEPDAATADIDGELFEIFRFAYVASAEAALLVRGVD